MNTSDFDFELPASLIAQHPPLHRGDSRMMVVHRATGQIEHREFPAITEYTAPGDLFVFNNTRVVPARFFSNDGQQEILRLEQTPDGCWRCLVKPGKRFKRGHSLRIGPSTGTVVDILEPSGERVIRFDQFPDETQHGHLALPPYISRTEEPSDQDRYQTVYAAVDGAIAAPTAGLHFSDALIHSLPHEFVTLHVGLGTFRPVAVEDLSEHQMHSEWYELSETASQRINTATRVIAVGTTVVRVLESCSQQSPSDLHRRNLHPRHGETNIFIHPPYQFTAVDALLTNFHLPKSTLLMLVSAFAGRELVMHAYHEAIKERYRFFSYGDCLLFL